MIPNGSFTPPLDPRTQIDYENGLSSYLKSINSLNQINSGRHHGRHHHHHNHHNGKMTSSSNTKKIFGNSSALNHQPRSLCEMGYLEMIQDLFSQNTPQLKILLSENADNLAWFPFLFLDCFFNSISSVILCSNPFSGLIIFVSMLHSSLATSLIATVSLLSGILTSLLIVRIPSENVRSGGITFNSFLTGTLIGEMARTGQYDLFMKPAELLVVSAIFGSLVIFIWGGLNGIFTKLFDSELPLLNAPFNLIAILYLTSGFANLFITTKGADVDDSSMTQNGLSLEEIQNQTFRAGKSLVPIQFIQGLNKTLASKGQLEIVDWGKVLTGVLMGPSVLFGLNKLITSISVYCSLLLFSPILCAQSFLGSLIGTLIGVFVTSFSENLSYTSVYMGNWGYSSLLTSSAIGGLFMALNIHSFILSIVGSIIASLIYAGLALAEKPIFGMAFMLATWLILSVNFLHNLSPEAQAYPKKSHLYFKLSLDEMSTPEIHRRFLKGQNLARILP